MLGTTRDDRVGPLTAEVGGESGAGGGPVSILENHHTDRGLHPQPVTSMTPMSRSLA